MKKFTILMAAIALVCFSVPAMAVDWNFYGNARMQTYYFSDDYKDVENAAGTDDKDADLRWDLQGNSRVGADIKADHIRARFEYGTGVNLRRLYGIWNFGPGTLKVGQDYTPITQFISNQAVDVDLGLLYFGAPYGGRHGQVALGFGGFEVALINMSASQLDTDDLDDTTDGDEDRVLPKIEASYGMSFDAFNFKVMGGYQYYSIEDVESLDNPGSFDDLDVTSYIIAAGGTFNFGPAYVGAQVEYGQNFGNAGWLASYTSGEGRAGDWDVASAKWDGDDDTNDVTTYGGILVVGMKVSDMLSFELGGGYIVNDPDDAPKGFDEKTKAYSVYLNSTIALAPGVFIVPEVGMHSHGNNPQDDDMGTSLYVGGKWQINF